MGDLSKTALVVMMVMIDSKTVANMDAASHRRFLTVVPGAAIVALVATISLGLFSGIAFSPRDSARPAEDSEAEADVYFKVFRNDSDGWGYDVYRDDAVFIHQPHVPAIVGHRGFSTEEDARRVAALVAEKIREEMMPPTVSLQELTELGVVK